VPESSKKNGFLSLPERAGNWKHQKRLQLAAESASMSCFISSSLITNSVKPQLEHRRSGRKTKTGDLRKSFKPGKWMQISAANVF
jgi:hypothetical protein